MRTTGPLDSLFSRSVQEILAAILLERDGPWYSSDLAKRLRRTPSTLQRPLESLVRAGILRRWLDGNRVYFAPDPQCPFLPELRSLLAKTVGLVDVLRDALRAQVRRIKVAFVYGSMATGKEHSQSDVDLLVIGSVTLAELAPVLAKAEKRIGRPVNVTIFPSREFFQRMAQKNHFLRSVTDKDKIFVIGTPDDLENLARRTPRRTARHKPRRAR